MVAGKKAGAAEGVEVEGLGGGRGVGVYRGCDFRGSCLVSTDGVPGTHLTLAAAAKVAERECCNK